jgi:hypothetical protein
LANDLASADNFTGGGRPQLAFDTYGAMLTEIAGLKSPSQIAVSCTYNFVKLDPRAVLTADVQGLIANFRSRTPPAPVTGYALDGAGSGVAGVSLILFDSLKRTLATATTDAAGFYYFPTTGALAVNSLYGVRVAQIPKPFRTATPASQTFTYQGSAVPLANFVLN